MTITLDRTERLNALNAQANVELAAVFDAFEADADLRVAILTGRGDRAFCVGADLKEWAAHGPAQLPASGFGGLTHRGSLRKPVIAAVNGLALGGGFELALACDLIVATAHAEFGLPEPRIGTAATAGGVQRLASQVPTKLAASLILTGRRLTAHQAAQWGLVSEVLHTHGELLSSAHALAADIVRCAPLAVQACKALMRSVAPARAIPGGDPLPEVQAMWDSTDRREGPAAFAQKRAPTWQGR